MSFTDRIKKGLSRVFGGGWKPYIINEPFAGAWQRNLECTTEDMLAHHAVYACISLIASDISKLPLKLVRKDVEGIWSDYENSAYSPILRKPNRFQNRIQFFESWVLSILTHGNAYILKKRDGRNVVQEMFILDPTRVTPLVSESGEVFYELKPDAIAGIGESVTTPASEIIHDRMNPLYHPLVGVSPLYAAALPVLQGRTIQENAIQFFTNRARPGGVLTAPGALEDSTVEQLKASWKANYSGENSGAIAVLADGLTYKSFDTHNAEASQVIQQLGWTAEVVCSLFHIPGYMVGVGETPSYNNVEALNQQYYAQALQARIENIELCLDEGLKTPLNVGTEFDLDGLLRTDSLSLVEAEKVAVGAGIKTINESRKRMNLPPIEGGDTAYLQVQNFSVAALARRDARENPFANDNGTSAKDQIKFWELEYKIKKLEELNNAA